MKGSKSERKVLKSHACLAYNTRFSTMHTLPTHKVHTLLALLVPFFSFFFYRHQGTEDRWAKLMVRFLILFERFSSD